MSPASKKEGLEVKEEEALPIRGREGFVESLEQEVESATHTDGEEEQVRELIVLGGGSVMSGNPNDTGVGAVEGLESESSEDEDDGNNFLVLPHCKAKKTRYPPGCPVLVCSYGSVGEESDGPNLRATKVLIGKVESVVIDLDSNHRSNLYTVRVHGIQQSLLKLAAELQFAPRCPIWFRPDSPQKESAVVLGSEHYSADSGHNQDRKVLYSLKAQSGKLYHGIPTDQLEYRFREMKQKAKQRASNKSLSLTDKDNETLGDTLSDRQQANIFTSSLSATSQHFKDSFTGDILATVSPAVNVPYDRETPLSDSLSQLEVGSENHRGQDHLSVHSRLSSSDEQSSKVDHSIGAQPDEASGMKRKRDKHFTDGGMDLQDSANNKLQRTLLRTQRQVGHICSKYESGDEHLLL